MKPHVIIYSRPGCHLCEDAKAAIKSAGCDDQFTLVDAKAAIKSAGCDDQFTLEEINIESDSELLTKYKYDIPVITIDGLEAFLHRLTPQEFKQKLSATKRHKSHKR